MEANTLRSNVFNKIESLNCDRPSCEFKGNVKYDNFLHNVRIHRRCILCEKDCDTKKGIMDHLAFIHQEKTSCDMCEFQVYPFERSGVNIFPKIAIYSPRFENPSLKY